jgi:hypothetical protein
MFLSMRRELGDVDGGGGGRGPQEYINPLAGSRALTASAPANCLVALSISHSLFLLLLRNLPSHLFRMSTEKFFENAGRPLEMVEQAQFLNAKPEQEAAERDVVGPLPSPASASSSKPKTKLSAAMIIPIWIVLSSGVIIYNNYLYNTLNFKYPVFLVTFHLGFAVRALQPTSIDQSI